jgi:hypothetical protein
MLLPLLRPLRTDLPQGPHVREFVGGHGQHEQLIASVQAVHHHLAHRADQLGPAKALLNEFSLLLRDGVALGSGHAVRYGRAAPLKFDTFCT